MLTSGNLTDVSLAETLAELHQQRKSGTLLATRGSDRASVILYEGMIIGTSAPGGRRLGEILATARVIDGPTLRRALARQIAQRPRRPLGRILVESGEVGEAELRAAVETQARRNLGEMLEWRRGWYEFISHPTQRVDSIEFSPSEVLPRTEGKTEETEQGVEESLGEELREAVLSSPSEPAPPVHRPMKAKDWARSTARRAAVKPPDEQSEIPEEVRNIGFYANVQVAQRSFHVQTEVIARREACIQSTVLEGGTVLYTDRQPFPADMQDVHQVIEKQHQRVVDRVSRGELVAS